MIEMTGYHEIDGTSVDAEQQIRILLAEHGDVPVIVTTCDGGCAVYGHATDALKDVGNQCSHATERYEHYIPDHLTG